MVNKHQTVPTLLPLKLINITTVGSDLPHQTPPTTQVFPISVNIITFAVDLTRSQQGEIVIERGFIELLSSLKMISRMFFQMNLQTTRITPLPCFSILIQ